MMVFVFGSNRSGVHGAGAARFALLHHGAEHGVGEGLRGTSFVRSIALATPRGNEYAAEFIEDTNQSDVGA